MKNIGMIFARSLNYVIGVDNSIPWKYKGEQKRFKEITENSIVVMGRKTWESLPENRRPLPNRVNVLITSSREQYPVEYQFSSVDEFMRAEGIRLSKENKIWFIGGRRIFSEALAYCDIIDDTLIPERISDSNRITVYLPSIIQVIIEGEIPRKFLLKEANAHPYNDKLIVHRFERNYFR